MDRATRPRLVRRWLIWLIFVLAWSLALLTPNPVQPAGNPTVQESLFHFTKGLHVGAYAVMAILSGWLRVPARFRWLLLGFLSVHAVGVELLQSFVPTRTPSLLDMGLDHVGALWGVILSWPWWSSADGNRRDGA